MTDLRPILIAGPTASGKSGLALRLAEELDGAIINADSMQVYRELRVLTARPGAEDEARVPHLLYGMVGGAEAYSAGRYALDAARALAEARSAGRRPIIVGGTGLYFKTLVEGLSPIPPVPDDVRARWRAAAEAEGAGRLHALLAERDAEMAARLAPTDTQRIVRALEVLEATGVSLAAWQRHPREPVLDLGETIPLLVAVERDILVKRIDARFRQMIGEGAIEEVVQLERLGLSASTPIMGALGVRALLGHLAGKSTLEEAVAAGQLETRQYAKRQATWVRGNMIAWRRMSAQEMEQSAREIVLFGQDAH
jgi:tRNA dimethylallyltransferase